MSSSYLLLWRKVLVASALLGLLFSPASRALAVTLGDDPVPHMWHSFNTPENAFLGLCPSRWDTQAPGALYAEWGGFIPDARGSWVFSTPTVGLSAQTSAMLTETSGTGLITGAGNIYGLAYGQVPGPPLVFNLIVSDLSGAVPATSATRTVVMRSGTKGVLPNLDVMLNGSVATGVSTFRVDGTIDMPTGPGGAMEANTTTDGEWFWIWRDVPAAGPYRFDFSATVGHMSLDNLVVYASPAAAVTPPPATTRRRFPLARTSLVARQFGEIAALLTSP